jgi:hypothetical protein
MATKNQTNKKQEQKNPAPARGEKVSVAFKQAIKAYLDRRAADDALFAKTYAKGNKSLDECCNYILQQVRKSGRCGFDDDEIYNMAIHYYDEDDIKDVKPVSAKVVVNHTVELSEAEKAEAKEKAKADYEKEQLAKLKEEERKREERERKAKDERIRKAREAAERQRSLQLSLFDM